MPIHMSMNMSIHKSIHMYIHMSIHMSMHSALDTRTRTRTCQEVAPETGDLFFSDAAKVTAKQISVRDRYYFWCQITFVEPCQKKPV